MQWGNQQAEGLKKVDAWYKQGKSRKPVFVLNGLAGTGKTTLAKHFAGGIDGEVGYAAFTGKASLVMRRNGCVGARTIHSLIYKGEEDPETGVVEWSINRASDLKDMALLIVDEHSMMNQEQGKDLLSFGVPILALGDPFQLPPVSGTGFFSSMEADVTLTEIHRQAKENPIIYLADQVRNKIMLEAGEYGSSKVHTKMTKELFMASDQILVGRNITRHSYNSRMRKYLGYGDFKEPHENERLICLKNDRDLGIYNGETFTHVKTLPQKYKSNYLNMFLKNDDPDRIDTAVRVHKSFFDDEVPVPDWRGLKGTQEFDYGYAISVHKAQGSQFESPLILDESYCFREDKWRWIYTAISRAIDKVDVVLT